MTGLYLVVSGTVTLAPDSNVPHSLKTAVGPGAVAGLPATVSGQPFRRTAVVTEDAHLVFVARPAVLELFRAKPQFCLQAIHTLGEEMLAVHTGISALTDRRRAGDRH